MSALVGVGGGLGRGVGGLIDEHPNWHGRFWVPLGSSSPLMDMTMMGVRGVWTANLAAFLVGAGLYAWFLLLPQLAQLPRSTGFGYGASVVIAGLYLLPCAIGMGTLGSLAGRVGRRFGPRRAPVARAAVSAAASR